jgi:hypothetical protein
MAVLTGPKIGAMSGASLDDLYLSEGNTMLRMLQALVQGNVIDLTATPPASPADGDTYIVDVGATGAWAGHDNSIAYYTTQNLSTSGWDFWVPQDGWLVSVTGTFGEAAALWRFNGTEWTVAAMIGSRGTGAFNGAGTAITVNLAPGFDNIAYTVLVSYDSPTVAPGILSIEYISGTQFKIHSSSATDASNIRYCTVL